METNVLGKPLNRFEGRLKVTGAARYAGDYRPKELAFAFAARSEIAAGEVLSVDATEAEVAPGVLGIIHALDSPEFFRCPESVSVGERRPPLEDKMIYYAGQIVAVVVAETYAQARWAAGLLKIKYREDERFSVDFEKALEEREAKVTDRGGRGDPGAIFDESEARVDASYDSPVESHCAMELHVSTAWWEEKRLVVEDSTQHVLGQREALARTFGMPESDVEARSRFIGGGFGSKLFLWPHCILAAEAARSLGRPVQFMLDRRANFTTAGNRPFTKQRVRIGADRDGRFRALLHEATNHTSLVHDYEESCTDVSRSLYSCPDVATIQRTIRLNTGSPTPMRGPGETPGLWALESAIDELAVELGIDPLELRLRNVAERDEDRALPWSSNLHGRCLKEAAKRFGWERRNPQVGSMREGEELIGWGLASASWEAMRTEANVSVEFLANGSARVACATQDIGTGTYTVFAQVVSELTGLGFDNIEVLIGDTRLPKGPISGGSMATGSVVPAIADATDAAILKLAKLATTQGGPFAGRDPEGFVMRDGKLCSKDRSARVGISELLEGARQSYVKGEATAQSGEEQEKYSFRSFGAHCVEVRWNPDRGRLRVARVASVIDAGRIINHKTASNQVYGSIVMGVGMALLERCVYDKRSGRLVTDNLADYLVPVMTDAPEMDLVLLDEPDPRFGRFGARGIGEIGLTGVAAAIANAVYHATGRRIRSLPIRLDSLLESGDPSA